MDKLLKSVGTLFDAFRQKSNGYFGIEWLPLIKSMDRKDMYQGIVYACIDLIAKRTSTINFALVAKQTGDESFVIDQDDKIIESNEIVKILRNPNKLHTYSTFMYLFSSYFMTKGEVFLWPIPSLKGDKFVQLLFLDPDCVTIHPGGNNINPIKKYSYSSGGFTRDFQPDEIRHVYWPNPYLPLRGISPITMARLDIESELSAKEWNSKFFKNGGSPSGIFKIATADRDTFKDAEQKIRDKYSGSDNAFKLFILNKDSDYTPITPSQRDMEFIEQMNMSEKRIHKIFKVPSIFLGATDDAKYANVWAAKRIFNEVVIEPILRQAFEHLNEILIPKSDKTRLKLKYENPVPEDFEYSLKKQEQDRHDRDQSFKYMTIDEHRELSGLSPLPGGEGKVLFDRYVSQGRPQPEPTKTLKKKDLSPAESMYDAREKYLPALEEKYRKKLSKHFDKLVSLIKSGKSKKAVGDDPLVSTLAKEIWPDTTEWQGLFTDIAFGFSEEAINEGAVRAVQMFNLPVEFSLKNTTAIAWLNNRIRETSDDVAQTLYNRAREVIARNIDDKVVDISKIRKEVAATILEERDWRVERIVRTELLTAYAEGSAVKYEEAKVERLIWFTAEDERVCPICAQNHNEIVLRGTMFASGNTHEPAHIQCRCTTAPAI